MGYLGNDLNSSVVVSKTRKTFVFNATSANQTIFTGADKLGQILDCLEGDHVFVFANGVLLLPVDDYTVGAGSITLVLGADLNDEITISTDPEAILYDGYTKSEIDGKIVTVNTALALKVGVTSATGAATLPVGTSAQRPSSPTNGMTRFNTDINSPEWYHATSSSWIKYAQGVPYTIDILAVAGGGGGGAGYYGGGGGAGGLIVTNAIGISSGASLTINVGAGGSGSNDIYTQGSDGGASSVILSATSLINAIGGGGAGSRNLTAGGAANGRSGGSGGGAAWPGSSGGSGTSGQGYAGVSTGSNQYGGGGGGAGGTGTTNGEPQLGGSGGIGSNTHSTWLSATSAGESNYIAGGGGAGTRSGGASIALGGLGGGGDAGVQGGRYPEAGYANMGGGGGGADTGDNNSTDLHYRGAAGGSGLVIIRYTGSQKALGGTVYSSGGYTYHKFTSSGTFTA